MLDNKVPLSEPEGAYLFWLLMARTTLIDRYYDLLCALEDRHEGELNLKRVRTEVSTIFANAKLINSI